MKTIIERLYESIQQSSNGGGMSGTFPMVKVSALKIATISSPMSSSLVCLSPTSHCLNLNGADIVEDPPNGFDAAADEPKTPNVGGWFVLAWNVEFPNGLLLLLLATDPPNGLFCTAVVPNGLDMLLEDNVVLDAPNGLSVVAVVLLFPNGLETLAAFAPNGVDVVVVFDKLFPNPELPNPGFPNAVLPKPVLPNGDGLFASDVVEDPANGFDSVLNDAPNGLDVLAEPPNPLAPNAPPSALAPPNGELPNGEPLNPVVVLLLFERLEKADGPVVWLPNAPPPAVNDDDPKPDDPKAPPPFEMVDDAPKGLDATCPPKGFVAVEPLPAFPSAPNMLLPVDFNENWFTFKSSGGNKGLGVVDGF